MNKNKKISKKFLLVFSGLLLLIVVLFYQYYKYSRSFKLSSIDKQNSNEINDLNTNYLQLFLNEKKGEDLSNIKIETNLNDKYEIILTNDKDMLSTKVENILNYNGFTEDEIKKVLYNLSTKKYVLLKKTVDQSFQQGQSLNITLSYKNFNIFEYFKEPKTIDLSYVVTGNKYGEGDFWEESIAFLSGAMPQSVIESFEEIDRKCPVRVLQFEIKSNDFDTLSVDCPFARGEADLGEDVTVEIYTSDLEQGKQAFRDWLAENGLQESDKLRVEYVHKPK